MNNLTFNEKNVLLHQEIDDWEDAVRKGCRLLEVQDLVEEVYADNIIKKIKELGPYVVLCEGLAMPHARPEEGVKSLGYSIITTDEPIDFLGNNVQIVLTLAAPDNNSHIDLLQKIVELANGDKLEKIKTADSIEELAEIINQ